jgi:RNA-binding protein 25
MYIADDDSTSQTFIGPVGPASREDQHRAKIGFSSIKSEDHGDSESPDSSHPPKRKKMTVQDAFNQDDDTVEVTKKRKLVPLDYELEKKKENMLELMNKPTTAEEKRKCIKNLIEKIPTGKEELFAYYLDWDMVDQTLMDRRIKPWINKKIVEYIGEEEPTLTDFICQKVMAHSTPQMILNDVAMVLDEEAEVFVVKMWRLLIYETEAKKAGLVK